MGSAKRLSACLLSLLFLCQSAAAEESIEDLLKTYRKESDLSRRTKKENAGFVVVYTRDDLERMQVYRLTDILRELRFQSYMINDFGMVDPIHIDPYFYSSDVIKVYVNDHEITTGFSGSGLQFYGNVDMGMFDHVEVYYHTPVLDIATEPAAILVKLYTKEPERENGGSLSARLGERGSQEISASYARVMGEWSYYAYAEESENNFRHEHNRVEAFGRDYTVSRDYAQQHLYLDLHKKSQRLELEYLGQKHDPFTAQSVWITPTGGDWEQPMLRAAYSSDFLDDSLHLDASYVYSELTFDMRSDAPFWGQMIPDYRSSVTYPPYGTNRFHLHVDGNLFTAKSYYEKRLWPKHLVKAGVEYRYKDASVSDYRFNTLAIADRDAYMHYGSVYLQDQYAVLPNAMLSASFKYNYYDFTRHSDDPAHETLATWQGRVAFSYLDGPWSYKAFLNHVEFPTQLYVLVLHNYTLDSQIYNAVSGEVKRLGEKNDIRFLLSRSWMSDIFIMHTLHPQEVIRTDFRMTNASFDYTHRFSDDHRLDFNLNWSKYRDLPVTKTGFLAGYVRLLDTFGDLDLFNEVIYREKTPYLDTGWDYSAGAVYHVTRDFKIAIKGVNILDKAQDEVFVVAPGLEPSDRVILPIVGRQLYVSMEWLF